MRLKTAGIHAIKWSVIDKMLKRLVQFIMSVFLARLLTPSDFGVVAMAGIFTAWADVFKDFGLGQSIVQQQNVTERQTSTIFYINLSMGLLIALIFFFIAPFAAEFYKNEIVGWVIKIAGLSFFIQSFNVVQGALLNKALNFKVSTVASLLSSIISGSIGVIMAFSGFGVWSLIVQGVINSLISTLYIWYKTTWRPKLIFAFGETKPMFHMGMGFMSQGLINSVFSSIDSMVIGKYYNPATLGLFSRGKTLADMTKDTLLLPITRPLFPIFARLQDDPDLVKALFLKIVSMLDWVIIFIAGMMLISSNEVILILYGEKWIEAAKYLFLFAILTPIYPSWTTSSSVWKAFGKVKIVARFALFERISMFLALLLGVFYSVDLYVYLLIITLYICSFIRAIYNRRVLKISIKTQYKEWLKNMIVLIPVLILFYFWKIENIYLSITVKFFSLVFTYYLGSVVLKLKGMIYIKQELKNLMKSSI